MSENVTSPKRIEPWAIGVPAVLVVFATAMISFAVWTTSRHDALVNDDYYALDVAYQNRIDQMERALEDNALRIEQDARSVRFSFDPAPEAGTVRFYRPSDAELDQTLELGQDAEQLVPIENLQSGLWIVQVEWSAGGTTYYLQEYIVHE